MLKRKQPLALPKSSHSKFILFYYERPRGKGRPNLFLSVARATQGLFPEIEIGPSPMSLFGRCSGPVVKQNSRSPYRSRGLRQSRFLSLLRLDSTAR